jgi:hypothetical protein
MIRKTIRCALAARGMAPHVYAGLWWVLHQSEMSNELGPRYREVRSDLRLPKDVAPLWLTAEEIRVLTDMPECPIALRRRLIPQPHEYTAG